MNNFENLQQYVAKKGIGYFISNASAEDKKAFAGILFDSDGFPILSNIYRIAGVPI